PSTSPPDRAQRSRNSTAAFPGLAGSRRRRYIDIGDKVGAAAMARKSIALALSSGGARGLAHIGAIRCLEDHGFEIRCIAGSSIGALVGGIYAAGKLDVYAGWVRVLERRDIVRLLDLSLTSSSVFKG